MQSETSQKFMEAFSGQSFFGAPQKEAVEAVMMEGNYYMAFRPEEREAAKVARLQAELEAINKMARAGEHENISLHIEAIPDIDFYEDTKWMEQERQNRSEALPAAV